MNSTDELIMRLRVAAEHTVRLRGDVSILPEAAIDAADEIERQAKILRGCLNTLRIVRESLGLPPESNDGGNDLLQAISARRNVALCQRPINCADDASAAWCVLSGNCGCDHDYKRIAAVEGRRLMSALEDLEVHATREIVPNWVGVPVVEWDAVFRLLSLHGARGP